MTPEEALIAAKPQRVQRRPAGDPSTASAEPAPAAGPDPVVAAPMPEPQDTAVSEDTAGFVRRPFGTSEQKLSAPKRAGYHRHWFNDIPGRVDRAKEAGYAHVANKKGSPIKRVVGASPFGGPLVAYLMEIPIAWFQEDMAREQKKVDEIDAALRGDDIARKPNDQRYTPKNAIKIGDDDN